MSGRAPPGFSRHAPADDDGRDLASSQEGSSALANGAETRGTALPVDKLKWQRLLECSSKSDAKPLALLACGSFNPVTNQHLRMLELARYEMQHQVRSLLGNPGWLQMLGTNGIRKIPAVAPSELHKGLDGHLHCLVCDKGDDITRLISEPRRCDTLKL